MPCELKRNVLFVNLFIFGPTKIYGYMLVGICIELIDIYVYVCVLCVYVWNKCC